MLTSRRIRLAAFAFALLKGVRADLAVYTDDAFASGWENWSWGSTINTAATDIFKGTSSLSVTSDAWSALSLKLSTGTYKTAAGLRFDVVGDVASNLQIQFESVADGVTSPQIPFSTLGNFSTTAWTTVTIDFAALPGSGTPLGTANWDRLNLQGLASGATYHLDNVAFVDSIVIPPKFLSAEPLTSNTIAVTHQGAVNLTSLAVKLNGQTIAVSSRTTISPIDAPAKFITYLNLASNFAAGTLVISSGNTSFTHTLPAVTYGSVTAGVNKAISPHIYGVNWAPSAAFVNATGVTVSRWGGNSITAYNPFKDVTNAGHDWYFENRNAENGNANTWLGDAKSRGTNPILTVPALDWVSKDNSSYSYPKTIYPNQDAFDPYKPDAGNGRLNGTYVTPPPNPTNAYEAWNMTRVQTWLKSLTNVPEFVAIDNEIEIASSSHQDMHPTPLNFDELVTRVIGGAKAVKAALPNAKVFGPTVCNWWFYWTSSVGYSDNAAHNNMDYLPYFLQQAKNLSTAAGKDLLDYLDVHFYPDFPAGSGKDLYLRMTRQWWDPEYKHESWIGTDVPQHHQPNPNQVWLIPRLKQLVAQYYPGRKVALTEWSAMHNELDVVGGLYTADSLGLFGVHGLDLATYWWWNNPSASSPIGLAYWLFRGYGTTFGDLTLQFNPSLSIQNWSNLYGFYAGADKTSTGKKSFVFINKDTKPVATYISNIPTGQYFVRHFGGEAGLAKWQTTLTIRAVEYFVVPAYTAVFFKQV